MASDRQSVPLCPQHGEKSYVECWNCEDGFSGHDCGEDCCVCLEPEENVRCDICRGKGGWYRCFTCHPETEQEMEDRQYG